jgi:hypothetical protein
MLYAVAMSQHFSGAPLMLYAVAQAAAVEFLVGGVCYGRIAAGDFFRGAELPPHDIY